MTHLLSDSHLSSHLSIHKLGPALSDFVDQDLYITNTQHRYILM